MGFANKAKPRSGVSARDTQQVHPCRLFDGVHAIGGRLAKIPNRGFQRTA